MWLNFKCVNFKHILGIDILSIHVNITLGSGNALMQSGPLAIPESVLTKILKQFGVIKQRYVK